MPVFDGGKNLFQFIHADDLASACIAAGQRQGFSVYNIGAKRFGTMAETLGAVIKRAGTGSHLRSVPRKPTELMMRGMGNIGASPLGPYHALVYGCSFYFDTTKAERELNWTPRYSNEEMICESYDWYRAHFTEYKNASNKRSHHKNPIKQRALAFVPAILKLFSVIEKG